MIKNLGQRIRKLRKEKNLTLVDVAEKTAIAQATLSRIETGGMVGTVESHEKIAEVLGIGLAELYTGVDSRYDQTAHTSTKDRKVTQHTKNVHVELLTTESSKKKITPLLFTLTKGSKTQSEKNDRGVEKFIYVLEGTVSILIDRESFVVGPGETLYFDASIPHRYLNEEGKTARFLLTVSPSKI